MSSLVAETRNWDEESSVNITQKEKLLWTGCIWRQWKFCNSHHSTLSNRKKSTSTARETSGKTSMIMDRKVRGKHLSWDTVFTFMRLQTTSRNLGERLGGLVFSERPRSTMEHRAWWSTMTHLVTKNPKKKCVGSYIAGICRNLMLGLWQAFSELPNSLRSICPLPSRSNLSKLRLMESICVNGARIRRCFTISR